MIRDPGKQEFDLSCVADEQTPDGLRNQVQQLIEPDPLANTDPCAGILRKVVNTGASAQFRESITYFARVQTASREAKTQCGFAAKQIPGVNSPTGSAPNGKINIEFVLPSISHVARSETEMARSQAERRLIEIPR